jgi:hypothetical protein
MNRASIPSMQVRAEARSPVRVFLFLFLVIFLVPPAQSRADQVDAALLRATQFLLNQQDETGAIWERKPHMRNQSAMSALAVLSLTSMGHQPADPTPEGQACQRALGYVLRPDGQEPDGYFGSKDGSRMYGHGIITLMLSEMLGMGADSNQDELIRQKARRAIELILRAQKVPKNEMNKGGWRYTPDSGDSDMSVTVWQTMALRAAKNAGFDVPKSAIDDAVAYIRRCHDPGDLKSGKGGGFGYQSRGRELSTTAEGLLALQVCGQYDIPEVISASDRLLREGVRQGERWFFYLGYYYAQGMYQRGGKHATEGRRVMVDALLPLQSKDGSWEGMGGEERQGGKIYATALAVLSLTVKNHFLPIYQR